MGEQSDSMTDEAKAIEFLLNNMRVEYIPIEDVIPNPENPRVNLQPGMPLYDKLKDSIDHFNYMEPIIWNKRSGMIVAGHQRFTVLKAIAEERGLELKKIPVVVVDLSKEDESTFMISSNRITGLWDNEKLSALFREMDDEHRKLTGYEDFEIDAMVSDITEDIDEFEDEEETEEPKEKKVKTVICPHCGKEFEM